MKSRLAWADNAKALGMCLVFWGHLLERGAFNDPSMIVHDIYKAIYAFHMPFFFLLAGYFFKPRDLRFGALVVEKFKSRLVPVIFFVGLSTLFWQVPGWWGLPEDDSGPLQALQKFGLLYQGKPAVNWPCWFLVCLFVVELAASEVMPFARSRGKHLIAIAVCGLLAWQVASDIGLSAARGGFVEANWWFLQEATVAIIFYLVGQYIRLYGSLVMPDGSKRAMVVMLVVIAGFLMTFNRNFSDGLGVTNMSGGTHGSWQWFWPAAVLGSLALIHIAALVPPSRVLSYIGNNTVPLLGLNGMMLEFYNTYLWAWCEPYMGSWSIVAVTLGVALGSLLLCFPIVYLFNKLVPFLVGQWK